MASSLFSGLDSLVGLAQHGVDVKPTLLRVLTDLYVQKPTHTADEERQYVELAVRLIAAVDHVTRRIVAEKLAAYPGAPVEILDRLRSDDTEEFAVLAPAHDVWSPTAASTDSSFDASGLADRFFDGDAARRRTILAQLATSYAPAAARPDKASEIGRNLEVAVLGGRPSDFIRHIESVFGLPRGVAQRIVNDLSGEPLVVIAKALAMPIDALQRVLLFVNPAIGHSVERLYALSSLYAEVSPIAALRLLAYWRDSAGERPVERGRTAPTATTASRGGRGIMSEWQRAEVASARPAPGQPSGRDPVKKMAP